MAFSAHFFVTILLLRKTAQLTTIWTKVRKKGAKAPFRHHMVRVISRVAAG